MNLIIGLSLAVVVLGNGILLGRAIERRKAPTPRAAFGVELQDYLKHHNFVLTTQEAAASAWPHVYASQYAPRGKAIFVHPDTLAKLTREAGPEMMKAFQEWGDRHRYTSPFLRTCPHAWGDQRAEPHAIPVHECTLSVAIHGPKCVCRCGATAAYVEQPDGTIGKTFEEPKDDGS